MDIPKYELAKTSASRRWEFEVTEGSAVRGATGEAIVGCTVSASAMSGCSDDSAKERTNSLPWNCREGVRNRKGSIPSQYSRSNMLAPSPTLLSVDCGC